jgi:uncharacterized protein YecA (UPF0149 family)
MEKQTLPTFFVSVYENEVNEQIIADFTDYFEQCAIALNNPEENSYLENLQLLETFKHRISLEKTPIIFNSFCEAYSRWIQEYDTEDNIYHDPKEVAKYLSCL